MLVIPRATEKTYTEQTKHTYVFNVPKGASKEAIAAAVAEQFSVTVKDVRILVRKGKKTRYSKGKHAYPGTTYRQDTRLAYVTVGENDKIRVFDEEKVEDTSKVEENKEKVTKVKAEEKPAKKSGLFSRRTGNRGDK